MLVRRGGNPIFSTIDKDVAEPVIMALLTDWGVCCGNSAEEIANGRSLTPFIVPNLPPDE